MFSPVAGQGLLEMQISFLGATELKGQVSRVSPSEKQSDHKLKAIKTD